MRKSSWRITEDAVFSVVLFLVATVFLSASLKYPPASRLFPTLVLVPLMLGLAANALIAAHRPAEKEESVPWRQHEFVQALVWVLILVGLVVVAGLVGSMLLFPIIYMRLYCKESWRATVITCILLGICSYLFFVLLGIPMYSGIIMEALGY